MSYILDALRRSQAERDRGQVPGLNAQPGAVASPSPRGADGGAWRWWVPAFVALAALFAGLWWWRAGARPAAPPVAAPVAYPPATAQTPAAAPSVLPAPVPPVSALPPIVVSAPPAAPPVAVAPAAMPELPVARPVMPVVPPSVAAPAPSTAPAPRALSLAELSAEQRRELPPMAMGGSIWSENALSRFVMVNGQVVREGEAAAPGVTVERIGPKSVLLKWRGLRLELPI